MRSLVATQLLNGYSIRDVNPVVVSHLQFVDDTLLGGTKSWANVCAMRAVLVIFEAMSGLKVNFHKSSLVGVNIAPSWLSEVASVLNCKMGKVPFLYLGLSIGGNPRRLCCWDPIVNRVKARLSGWNSRFLSFGGCLVVLKAVLTSRPVYALSFFKAPSAWSSVCLQKEFGGLWVRQLKEFNIALLGKWCWRLSVDRGGFWYRVLVARYGEVCGRLEVGGRSCSSWWREVGRIRDGDGDVRGGWFHYCVTRKVEDGNDTLFWFDTWLGSVPLCWQYLFSLGVKEGGEAWQWRRRLWVWEEEMLEEYQWLWIPDPKQGYSVRGAYYVLNSTDLSPVDLAAKMIWHRQVLLKVSIFAWRLLHDCLPTKSNLIYRGVISPDAGLCVSGYGALESAQHLFLSCSSFASLWLMVRDWIGFVGVDTNDLFDHFVQFVHTTVGSKATKYFLQLIWLLCVWVLWTERNNRCFNNHVTPLPRLLDKVKYLSLGWLKVRKVSFMFDTNSWWSSPLQCLGIG
ncbi:putative reverse transcriptase domain-containing protein [Medicago truncatula]|uniref:Putative reverse transcriptase domain-containing protein n=1 Tax=Medicago truncatula TaxID=3880 RepID=A0A396JDP4_MEDTR|nr:putative reverse transcriptase domain-containing protein [Medicago truncatula]